MKSNLSEITNATEALSRQSNIFAPNCPRKTLWKRFKAILKKGQEFEKQREGKNIQSEENRTDISGDRKEQNTFVGYYLFLLNHPGYTHEFRILGR